MSKPSILLAPGSFALPEFYDELFDVVRAKGCEIRGLHKPTVGLRAGEGRPGTPPTMYDDAAFIASEVEKLADQGKDVILVGHSYGGVPVTESAKGLGKNERQAQGKKGGLVNIGYITCLVPAVGESARDVLAKVPDEFKTPMNIGVRNSLSPCASFFHPLLICGNDRKMVGCLTGSRKQLAQSSCRLNLWRLLRAG